MLILFLYFKATSYEIRAIKVGLKVIPWHFMVRKMAMEPNILIESEDRPLLLKGKAFLKPARGETKYSSNQGSKVRKSKNSLKTQFHNKTEMEKIL